jgi:outer membrane protein assembly factor BamB
MGTGIDCQQVGRSVVNLSCKVLPLGMMILWTAGQSVPIAHAEVHAAWNQWRGPARDGTYVGPTWPQGLDESRLQPQWRVELGPSYSGPLVVDSRVYTTETRDKRFEVVSAWNRETGTKIWETQWEGAMNVPFFAKANGDWIRSTPAFDDGRLYVAGMRDVLVCLDAESGRQIWRRDLTDELKAPLPAFGFVCSPLVVDDAVYVQAAASLLKLDKLTGVTIWRTLEDGGGMFGSAFASPYHATLEGHAQLLVQTREKLAGVELQSGTVLWEQPVPAFRGMNILTPTPFEDAVFTSSYGGKSTLFRVSRSEAGWEVSTAWTNKTQGYMSSPVIIDGHAYLHLRNQRFCCIDLSTGKETWITESFGQYWSLVAQGDHILALDERGELLLIRANPDKFERLDSRKISSDSTWAHLAVAGDQVFVRELEALTVYRWREP